MDKTMNNGYKEVKLDNNGKGVDGFYRNPLTKTYQYEYALYSVVSSLFESVRCRSICMRNLESYFLELPVTSEKDNGERKKTQEKLMEEVKALVNRDVIGKIVFPKINICAAEAAAIPKDDGTHTFSFSDGIYGFSLEIVMSKKGKPIGISVSQIRRGAHGKQNTGSNEDMQADQKDSRRKGNNDRTHRRRDEHIRSNRIRLVRIKENADHSSSCGDSGYTRCVG